MKKYFIPALLLASVVAEAQNTYLNERLANTSDDVIGTARYVGMGGAMGALGADMSTISWNPAGMGLFKRHDASVTFGGLWGISKIDEERRGTATFDQAGFVFNINGISSKVKYVNVSFNYQKKANYNSNFYADNYNLKGLSQMDQIAEFVNYAFDGYNVKKDLPNSLPRTAFMVPGFLDDNGSGYYYNSYAGIANMFAHHSSGALHGFEINASTNVSDRFFVGATLGIDDLDYKGWSEYLEANEDENGEVGDYGLYNDFRVSGYGLNFKLGTIIRPAEDSPFRLGFAFESPTWYRLKNSTMFSLSPLDDNGQPDYEDAHSPEDDNCFLEYTMRSPAKVRLSAASTVGTKFAWDVDYEFAGFRGMKMGYPKNDEGDYGSDFASTKDKEMNRLTKNTLKGVHTIRAGVEYKPTKWLALRGGYNFISSPYKKDASYDQLSYGSDAFYFSPNTNYMRVGATNVLTLGVGFRSKSFYADIAYKYRHQKGEFFAFDSNFTAEGGDFATDFPAMAGVKLDPVDVNLSRGSISCTLGVKF